MKKPPFTKSGKRHYFKSKFGGTCPRCKNPYPAGTLVTRAKGGGYEHHFHTYTPRMLRKEVT